MARPALDKKTGSKQQQVGKRRGRPPKAKSLEAVKTKPQKKDSVRTSLRKANKEKKEVKKRKLMQLSPQKKAAPKTHTKKGKNAAAAETATEEPNLSQVAEPAEPKPTSSVADYITAPWTYLSDLVRMARFGRQ